MLELQQSIFTILGFRCVSTFCSSWTPCFVLVFAVFLTLTRNRMIVYFEAKQPTRVADKNIFSSSRLHWGLVVLLGRFQDPCRSQQNIIDTAFCLACIWSKKISAVGKQTAAMLLCKWHNDSGADFPRSDGRLPSPPGPTLRDANRDFQGLPIRGCANIRRSVLQREPLARSVGDCRPPFVFSFFGQSRLFPAGSRCGCSFSSGSQPKFLFPGCFR